MSKLQNDPPKYVNYYRKYIFILAFVSMPLVACLAIFSKEIILTVLGPKWMPSSQIYQVLAILGLIEPVFSSTGLVMISSGQIKKYFILGCITSCVTISGFFIGIRWGALGVAASFVISTYLELFPLLYFSFKGTPVRIKHFMWEISLPILHTALIFGILIAARHLLSPFLSPLLGFALLVPSALIVYYFTWKIYPDGRKKLVTIENLIETVLGPIWGRIKQMGAIEKQRRFPSIKSREYKP